MCMILTKNDLVSGEKNLKVPSGWFSMSAITGDNVETVVGTLGQMVNDIRRRNSAESAGDDEQYLTC
jgi:hypothetical protein